MKLKGFFFVAKLDRLLTNRKMQSAGDRQGHVEIKQKPRNLGAKADQLILNQHRN